MKLFPNPKWLLPIFLTVFIGVLISACKKSGSDDTAGDDLQLSLSAAEISPYQFLTIQLTTAVVPENVNDKYITVYFDSMQVKAYPKQQSAAGTYVYSLIVPEMAPGSKKLKMAFAANKSAETTITITAFNKIANVTQYIKDEQTAAQTEINNAIKANDEKVKAGTMRSTVADSLKSFMQRAYDKNKLIVDALADDQKVIYAQLVDANKSWLNAYKDVYLQNPVSNSRVAADGDCEELRRQEKLYWAAGYFDKSRQIKIQAEQCEAERERKRLEANNIMTNKMKEAYAAAKAAKDAEPGRLSGAWAFVSTFVSEAGKGILETSLGIEDIGDPFAVFNLDDTKQQRIAAAEFEVDKEYQYSAGVQLVNVNSQNTDLFPAFGEMVQDINDYNTAMNDLGQFLPYVPEVKVPAAKTEKLYVAGFTIDQISDSRVKIEVKEGGKGKVIKISTNTGIVEESIPLSFTVNYKTNFGSASKTISASLIQPVDKILTSCSPLKITKWVEGDVDLFTMHEYWRWKCSGTEYINREQVLQASLTFLANGTGTSYENYHEIYYENKTTACDVNKVDRQKAYYGTMIWSYNRAAKTINAVFTDDEGVQKNVTANVSVQNGTITFSATGLLLAMQKQ